MEIQDLIKIYKASAVNLKKVADVADETGKPEEARVSRAKAHVYDMVVYDLEYALKVEEGQ